MDIPNFSLKPQFLRELDTPPHEIAPDSYASIVTQKKTINQSIDWMAEMCAPAARVAGDVIAAYNVQANTAVRDVVADDNLLRTYERLLETVPDHPTEHADLPLHAAVQFIQCLPAELAHGALIQAAELGKHLPLARRSEFFGVLYDALGAVPVTERLTACETLEAMGKTLPREYHFYPITAEAAALQVLPKSRDRVIIARRLLKRMKALDPRQAMIPLTGMTLSMGSFENGSGQIKLFRQLRKATIHIRNKCGRSGAGSETMRRVAELYITQAHQACLMVDEKLFTKSDLKPQAILRDSLRNRQLETTVDEATEKNLRAKIAEDGVRKAPQATVPASTSADNSQTRSCAGFQAEAERRRPQPANPSAKNTAPVKAGETFISTDIVLEAQGNGVEARLPMSKITSILQANPREKQRMEISQAADSYIAEHGYLPAAASQLDRTKVEAGLLRLRRLRQPGQPSRATAVQPAVRQNAPLGQGRSGSLRLAAVSGN